MKKNFKKLAAASVAATMALSMGSLAALAADITVENTKDSAPHTYAAYQVFAGTISGGMLNVSGWGEGVKGDELLAALKAETGFKAGVDFTSCTDAASVAEVVGKFADFSDDAKLFAQIVGRNLSAVNAGTCNSNGTITGVDAGYYLIKDNASVDGNGASTSFILKVLDNDITVTVKSGVPTLEKKVLEGDYSSTSDEADKYGSKYNDVADYSIGDEISFRLYGTVADNFKDFSGAYWYQFSDTIGNGLSFVDADGNGIVDVTVTNGVDGSIIAADKYTVAMVGTDGFTVTFKDLKTVTGVDKDSTLVVEYKARLNEDAVIGNPGNVNTAKLSFANNPNSDAKYDTDGTPEDEGETPEDKVVVLTYALDVKKFDASDHSKLDGVKFKLKNADGKYITVDANGRVTGADDTGSDLTTANGGLIAIKGIEDGIYTLEEVSALPGYKPIAPITLDIKAATLSGQDWTGVLPLTKLELNGNAAAGATASIDVENSKLSSLPLTGGMGTTVFYVVGLTLMAGAAVVLIARRKSAEE